MRVAVAALVVVAACSKFGDDPTPPAVDPALRDGGATTAADAAEPDAPSPIADAGADASSWIPCSKLKAPFLCADFDEADGVVYTSNGIRIGIPDGGPNVVVNRKGGPGQAVSAPNSLWVDSFGPKYSIEVAVDSTSASVVEARLALRVLRAPSTPTGILSLGLVDPTSKDYCLVGFVVDGDRLMMSSTCATSPTPTQRAMSVLPKLPFAGDFVALTLRLDPSAGKAFATVNGGPEIVLALDYQKTRTWAPRASLGWSESPDGGLSVAYDDVLVIPK